jgi:hypothetical protein
MKLHIEIDMSGAAFGIKEGEGYSQAEDEVWIILDHISRRTAALIMNPSPDGIGLMDSNDNTCGRAWTTED